MYSFVQMDATDDNTLMQQLAASPRSSPARTPVTPKDTCSQTSSAEECGEEEGNEVCQQSQLVQQQGEEKAVEVQPEPVKEEAVEAESKSIKDEASSVSEAVEVPHEAKSEKKEERINCVPKGFTWLALPPEGVGRGRGKGAGGISVAAADKEGFYFFDHMPAKNVQKYVYFLIKDSRSGQMGIITTANNTCLDFQSLAGCEYHKCTKFHTSLAAIVSCLPNSPHGPPIVLGMLSIIMQKHKMLEKQRFRMEQS